MLKELNSSIRIIIVSSLILALILPSATSAELIFPTDTKEFVIDEADVLTQTEVEKIGNGDQIHNNLNYLNFTLLP